MSSLLIFEEFIVQTELLGHRVGLIQRIVQLIQRICASRYLRSYQMAACSYAFALNLMIFEVTDMAIRQISACLESLKVFMISYAACPAG